jgi:hypothetical protein
MTTIRVQPGAESAAARFRTAADRGHHIAARVQGIASSSPFVPGDAVTEEAAAMYAEASSGLATAVRRILGAIAEGSDVPVQALESLAEADRRSGKTFGQTGVNVSV